MLNYKSNPIYKCLILELACFFLMGILECLAIGFVLYPDGVQISFFFTSTSAPYNTIEEVE